MRRYFKTQLTAGIPLTAERIEENILLSPFANKDLENQYRNRVGTFPLIYSLRDISEDNVILLVERTWDNELVNLPTDLVFEKFVGGVDENPVFQSKAYQNHMTKRMECDREKLIYNQPLTPPTGKIFKIGYKDEPSELQNLVKKFFENFVDVIEETDSGTYFNPVHIGCVRCMMTQPLNETLNQMRILSGAKPRREPINEDRD